MKEFKSGGESADKQDTNISTRLQVERMKASSTPGSWEWTAWVRICSRDKRRHSV